MCVSIHKQMTEGLRNKNKKWMKLRLRKSKNAL